MKKHLLLLATLGLLVPALTSCGGGEEIIQDGKTINVKAYEGGYGTTWLYQLKEKFEKIYETEGYKLNIVSTSGGYEGAGILSEMRMKNSGIDMYFVQNVSVSDVTSPDYGTCAASLNNLYSSKAIKFDGSEEDVTIGEKLGSSYTNVVKDSENYYGFLWANSPCGLICNTSILSRYSLDIPVTTNELFSCYTTIMDEGSIKPFAWGGSDAYGYALYALYPFLGQLMGKDDVTSFMNLQDGQEIVESDYLNGASRYDDDRIYQALTTVQQMYNTSTSVNGSLGGTNMSAHHAVMTGKAAFTVDGDFFYNEVKNDYSAKLDNIRFVNIPVASALGTNLKLDGTGNDEAKCDAILSKIIKAIDSNKSNSEIISMVSEATITEAQVNSIREARAVYYEKSCSNVYVSQDTQNMELCELLLKVAASDDFGHLFNSTTSTTYPYCSSNDLNTNEFSKGVGVVVNQNNAWGISNLNIGGLRFKAGVPMFPTYSSDVILTLVTEQKSQSEIKEKITSNVSANWTKWMRNAGYSI